MAAVLAADVATVAGGEGQRGMTTLGRLMPDRIPAMARMMEQQIREGGFKKHHEIFLLTLRISDLDALFDSMDGQVVQVILEGMSAAGKGSE